MLRVQTSHNHCVGKWQIMRRLGTDITWVSQTGFVHVNDKEESWDSYTTEKLQCTPRHLAIQASGHRIPAVGGHS